MRKIKIEIHPLSALLGAATVIVALGALSATAYEEVPDEIRARRFVVVDEDGTTRAFLGLDGSNATSSGSSSGEFYPSQLVLFSKAGISRISLEATEKRNRLMMYGRDGEQRVLLANIKPDGQGGTSTLQLSDGDIFVDSATKGPFSNLVVGPGGSSLMIAGKNSGLVNLSIPTNQSIRTEVGIDAEDVGPFLTLKSKHGIFTRTAVHD